MVLPAPPPPNRETRLAEFIEMVRAALQTVETRDIKSHFMTVGISERSKDLVWDTWFPRADTPSEFYAAGQRARIFAEFTVELCIYITAGHLLVTVDPGQVEAVTEDQPQGEDAVFIFMYDLGEKKYIRLNLAWELSENGLNYLVYRSLTDDDAIANSILAPFMYGFNGEKYEMPSM